jgi:hypothetical protein
VPPSPLITPLPLVAVVEDTIFHPAHDAVARLPKARRRVCLRRTGRHFMLLSEQTFEEGTLL